MDNLTDYFMEGLRKYRGMPITYAASPYHEFLVLDYDPADNAVAEGANYDMVVDFTPTSKPCIRERNFTQIMAKTIVLSGSLTAIGGATTEDIAIAHIKRALHEMARDFEYAVENNPIEGAYGSTDVPRRMKGLAEGKELTAITFLREPQLIEVATMGDHKKMMLVAELTYEYE